MRIGMSYKPTMPSKPPATFAHLFLYEIQSTCNGMGLVGIFHPFVYPPARVLVIGYDKQLVLEQYFNI